MTSPVQLNNEAVFILQRNDIGNEENKSAADQLKKAVVLVETMLRRSCMESEDDSSSSSFDAEHQGYHEDSMVNEVQVSPVPASLSSNNHLDLFDNYFLLHGPAGVEQEPNTSVRSPPFPQSFDQVQTSTSSSSVHHVNPTEMDCSTSSSGHNHRQRVASAKAAIKTNTASSLAVSSFNLALFRQLKYKKGGVQERELVLIAKLYESAFVLLTQVSKARIQDSAALVLLAICNNLSTLYLDLADLTKSLRWKDQLVQEQFVVSLNYHQWKLRELTGRDDILQCIQATSSIHAMFGARAA